MSRSRAISFMLAAAVLATSFTVASATAATAETSFEQRYQANQRGAVTRAANAIVTCKVGITATAPGCTDARNGANVSNNSYAFDFIDIDGDDSTFNSSSADLTLPASATVTHAQLYWGANLRTTKDTPGVPGSRSAPDAAKKDQVRFQAPGGSYTDLTADAVYELTIGGDPAYQARLDVTDAVKAAGAGSYTLADVQAARGSSNLGPFGGWTLVVAYEDSGAPLRNLTIYDGLRLMERFQPPITIDLSGFTTPATGKVNALLGAVAYDGDRSGTGDRMAVKTQNGPSTDVSDAANPASNVFNSSISTAGANESGRGPAYANTLGYDSDIYDVSSAFRNNDKSLRLTLSTNNENYAPGVVFMQIDLYEAHAAIVKKARVVDGGDAHPGSEVEYTMTVTSDGDDAAADVRVTDAIPADSTYVPGSLQIDNTAKTDDAADDQADFDSAANEVAFRLGSGADATSGGEMPKGATTTLMFRVTLDASAQGKQVVNTAKLAYTAKTLGTAFRDEDTAKVPVRDFADLTVEKTGPATVGPGGKATYTIVVTNTGPDTSRAVTLEDEFTGLSATPATTTTGCTVSGAKLTCALGDLALNATAKLTVEFPVPADARPEDQIVDTVTVDSPTLDPNKDNNKDKVTTTVVYKADVTIKKTAPAKAKAGQPVAFLITARNQGPDPALNTRVTDIVPSELRNVTWTCTAAGGAACLTRSGKGNEINVLANLTVGGQITIRIRGTVRPQAAGKTIRNMARIFLPPSVVDPHPSPSTSTSTTKVMKPPVRPKPKPHPKPKPKPRPPHNACRGCFPSGSPILGTLNTYQPYDDRS